MRSLSRIGFRRLHPVAASLMAICLSLCVAGAAQAEQPLYERAVAARAAQDHATAAQLFEAVLRREPRNADALVLLGYSRLALDQPDAARTAFEAALRLAPDYQDARLGLAQIAFRNANRAGASDLVNIVLAAQPDSAEALALRARLDAPPPLRWRLDLGGEYHDLSAGRHPWHEAITTLSYAFGQGTAISGTLRHADRGALDDTQVLVRLTHAFSPRLTVYGLIGAAPDADFLPKRTFALGGNVRLWHEDSLPAALWVNFEAKQESGVEGKVLTTRIGPRLVLYDDALAVSVDWLHGKGEAGTRYNGALVRLEGQINDRLRGVVGYAYAPEIDRTNVIRAQGWFAGLSYDIDDSLTLRATLARETRDAYDRNTLAIGLTKRF
ncbi:YaiO family outer membrane beta-barrel protein [Rhodobacter lacus]|uniref:YaiO family outer membrane beta-barrel protein n=1 Tax=Rhodobacter lacus TaxID=1641972 RepID=A0ABW5A8W0_9RHOB